LAEDLEEAGVEALDEPSGGEVEVSGGETMETPITGNNRTIEVYLLSRVKKKKKLI
jgi:hypothetical protein